MNSNTHRIGWIGMGRMGYPMAERLLKAGYDVSIWNRTRSKAEPLAKIGGKVVDKLFDLKLEVLVHNTIRGAAGAAILNAELLKARDLLP